MSDLTTYTKDNAELRAEVAARLEDSGVALNVSQYYGTSSAGMLLHMLAQALPAAIVYWLGEVANRTPQRPQRAYNEFHVMLLADDSQQEDAGQTVQRMLDAVKARLDEYVNGNTLWRYQSSLPVDLDDANMAPNVAAIDAVFEAGDH